MNKTKWENKIYNHKDTYLLFSIFLYLFSKLFSWAPHLCEWFSQNACFSEQLKIHT